MSAAIDGARKERIDSIERVLAGAVLFLLPLSAFSLIGSSSVTPGVMLFAVVCVVVIRGAVGYKWGGLVLSLIVLSSLSGFLLVNIARSDHAVDDRSALGMTFLLLGAGASFACLLWARTLLGPNLSASLYAAGIGLQALLTPLSWSTIPWKYAFAWPVAVLLLVVAEATQRRWLIVLAIAAIGLISVANDYRSYFGICLIVAVIFVTRWKKPAGLTNPRRGLVQLLGVTALGFFVLQLGVWLAVAGYLGERNRLVTSEQLAGGESILASGRVEWNAAFGFFVNRPFGFGPGVHPNFRDINLGKESLAGTGADLNGQYVNTYLLGDQIQLHSVLSDLWVNFGLVGMLLAFAFAVILVGGLIRMLAARSPSALLIFLVVVAVWDLAFSPIKSNLHEVLLAAALVMSPRRNESDAGGRGPLPLG